MTLHRGRIVRDGQPMTALTLASSHTQTPTPQGMQQLSRSRIVRRERLLGAQQARRLVAEAREEAARIIESARLESEQVQLAAQQQGLEQGAAKLATAWLVIQQREAQADRLSLDRSISIGRLLAERLIGASLRLDADLVAGIAREAMHNLWRSRKITIFANPEDIPALQRHIATFGMPPERIEVSTDPTRERGCLRFTSDLGELDGSLGPRLDRLEQAIRQELDDG